MKYTGKVFVLLMVIIMLSVCVASAEVYSGILVGNIYWSVDTQTSVLTISGSGDMDNITTPLPYKDYSFDSVVIKDGITSIG